MTNTQLSMKAPNHKSQRNLWSLNHWTLHCALFIVAWSFATPTSAATIARPLHNSGLVGYWSFEESTGSKTFDRSGNGNTGTLTNMAENDWVSGATSTGQALDFDGSDDTVNMGDVLDFGVASPATFVFWFKTRVNDPTAATTLIGKVDSGSGSLPGYLLSHRGDTAGNPVEFDWRPQAGWPDNLSISCPTNSSAIWQMVVVTYNGNLLPSGVACYLNGIAQTGTTNWSQLSGGSTVSNAGSLNIGHKDGGSNSFDGQIDEVRIYNRALSADEVTRLYNLKKVRASGGVTNTGLVGYWSFEEGTGSKAYDYSFNDNTGSLTNMEQSDWVQGRVGTALDFDGSNEYVNAGDVLDFERTDSFSIAVWAKTNQATLSSIVPVITKIGAGSSGYSLLIRGDNPGDEYEVELRSANAYPDIVNRQFDRPSNTDWQHLIFTYNGSSASTGLGLYINGVSQTPKSTCNECTISNTSVNSANLELGGRTASGIYFPGKIDEVRIYKRVLSATEAKALYEGSRATVVNKTNKSVLTNGLVGHWTFDGKDIYQTSALDSSGQGNTGTLTNGPTPVLGKIGQALNFDGSDDYVRVEDSSSLNFQNSSVSVGMWVYWGGTVEGRIISKANSGGSPYHGDFFMKLNVSTLKLSARFKTNDSSETQNPELISNINFPLNKWSHAFATFNTDTDTSRLYIDGVLVAEDTASIYELLNTTGFLCINCNASFPPQSIDGKIDDVRVYNRALSADEVKVLYNMGR
jgi:hypothetical protein